MSGRVKKKIASAAAAIGAVVTALVGSQAFGENAWVTNVTIAGLAITMVLNSFTTEDLSRDLRNGTFTELLRDALRKIADEESSSLEIRPNNDVREGDSDER
jgi:hypothetical protein